MRGKYKVWIHVERWENGEPIEEATEPRSLDTMFTSLSRAEDCVNDLLDMWELRTSRTNKKGG